MLDVDATYPGTALATGRAVMVAQRADDDVVLVRDGKGRRQVVRRTALRGGHGQHLGRGRVQNEAQKHSSTAAHKLGERELYTLGKGAME